MSNALIPMTDIMTMAKAVASSGLFGVKDANQALSLMLVAQAEGRHPALAARDYDIIQGKPAKKTEAMLRDFLENSGKVEWHQLDDKAAIATFSHPSGGSVKIGWDMERAKMAGLGGKDMWKKYPRQMLRSRCVSEGIRTVCPMATSGMYVPEEIQDFRNEKLITPTSGAIDNLTAERIAVVDEAVIKAQEWLNQGSAADAAAEIDNAALDADEMVYLWTRFTAKDGKALAAALRAPVAALPDTSKPITAAQHKRLEARINEVGIDREKVKKYCKKTWGVEHLPELNDEQYDTIDAMLDDHAAKHPKAETAMQGIVDMPDSAL